MPHTLREAVGSRLCEDEMGPLARCIAVRGRVQVLLVAPQPLAVILRDGHLYVCVDAPPVRAS